MPTHQLPVSQQDVLLRTHPPSPDPSHRLPQPPSPQSRRYSNASKAAPKSSSSLHASMPSDSSSPYTNATPPSAQVTRPEYQPVVHKTARMHRTMPPSAVPSECSLPRTSSPASQFCPTRACSVRPRSGTASIVAPWPSAELRSIGFTSLTAGVFHVKQRHAPRYAPCRGVIRCAAISDPFTCPRNSANVTAWPKL